MNILISLLALLLVDYQEFECMTEAVYYEAGNQPVIGKASVANVILNRVADNRWPDNVCDVVRQRGQFSYYWDGKPEPIPKKDNSLERYAVLKAKTISLIYLALPIADNTKGALYYHNDKIELPWDRVKMVAKVGNHIFYIDE